MRVRDHRQAERALRQTYRTVENVFIPILDEDPDHPEDGQVWVVPRTRSQNEHSLVFANWFGGPQGQFKLGYLGELTNWIEYNASAATMQSELEGLPSVGAGSVVVVDVPGQAWESWYDVEWIGPFAGLNVEPLYVSETQNFAGGPNVNNVSVTTTQQGTPAAMQLRVFVNDRIRRADLV